MLKNLLGECGKSVGMLGQLRKDLTHMLLRQYKSYILPALECCESVWKCFNKGEVNKLARLQRGVGRKDCGNVQVQ